MALKEVDFFVHCEECGKEDQFLESRDEYPEGYLKLRAFTLTTMRCASCGGELTSRYGEVRDVDGGTAEFGTTRSTWKGTREVSRAQLEAELGRPLRGHGEQTVEHGQGT